MEKLCKLSHCKIYGSHPVNLRILTLSSKKPENHLFWPYSESVSDSISDSDSLLGSDSVSGSDYVSDSFSDLVKYSGSGSISDYVTYFFQIL